MSDVVEITKEEAKKAATEQAFYSVDEDRHIIHCLSGFGTDLSLESVLSHIDQATYIAWVDHFMDHDLLLVVNGHTRAYQVKSPAKMSNA